MTTETDIRELLEQDPDVVLPTYERQVVEAPKKTQAESRKDIGCVRCMDLGYARFDEETKTFVSEPCPDCGKEADVNS